MSIESVPSPGASLAGRELQVRLPVWHVGLLTAGKTLDAVTTGLVLSVAPEHYHESNIFTAAAMQDLGLVYGLALTGIAAVTTVIAIAELAGVLIDGVADRLAAPGAWGLWFRATVYVGAAAWWGVMLTTENVVFLLDTVV